MKIKIKTPALALAAALAAGIGAFAPVGKIAAKEPAPENAGASAAQNAKAAAAERAAKEESAHKKSQNLIEGKRAFARGEYAASMDYFMQVLIADPHETTAKKYMRRAAEKILEPQKRRIEAERKKIMAEYKKMMAKRKIESPESIYSAVVANYNKKKYIKAYDGLRKLAAISPSFKNAAFYENNIASEMKELAATESYSDAEKLGYAKGFDAYFFKKNLDATAREWEKVLVLNPKRSEVAEYLKGVKEILADEERRRRLAELARILEGFYESGQGEFDKKKYVQSIKEWEKIVETVKKEKDFPDGPPWETKAKEAINRALVEIDKMASVKPPAPAPVKPAAKAPEAPKPEVIDEAAAARYYQEGLVSYAQGRLRDAVRSWDLALRMNPNHDKAKKAKEKAEAELQAGR